MKKSLFIIFGLVILAASQSFALPALPGLQNEKLRKLWDIPTGEVQAKTVKAYRKGPVKVEEVFYNSRLYNGKPVTIFGYFGYPVKRSGKLPAILLSHGGGGTASLARTVSWANRGYAVLSIDLPGKGENRAGSRSTGPDMIVANLLKIQPVLDQNYLIHAAAAARNGITYLTQRKEVDPNRIGMIGLSWGGVLTLLTNGQDNRLKAAVNVFGAGYIPEGCTWEKWFASMTTLDRNLWDNNLDPKNFLATQHAPILFITGTNDHCYYLTTFQKSYQEVTAPKNFYLVPNLRHRFLSTSQIPALAWLDQKLKTGGGFPTVKLLSPSLEASKIIIPVETSGRGKTKNARLYYCAGGPSQWTLKKWKELSPAANLNGGKYFFHLPISAVSTEVLFYASVRDQFGGSASTLVQAIFAVRLKDGTKTFALSGPINQTYHHEKPIVMLNGMDTSNLLFTIKKGENAYQFSALK